VFLCASSASRGRVTVAIYEDGDRRRNDDASGDTAHSGKSYAWKKWTHKTQNEMTNNACCLEFRYL